MASRVGRWFKETFRYGFLIVFFPRSITLEFLERPDTEVRRWLRLLPLVVYVLLYFQFAPGVFGPPSFRASQADWDGAGMTILNALLISAGVYVLNALSFSIPCWLWGGNWARVRTVASLHLYAIIISVVFILLMSGAITLAVYATVGEGVAVSVVIGLSAVVGAVTMLLAWVNAYTMQSAAIEASPLALFWLLNGGFLVGMLVFVVVMAGVRGPAF